jgi:hypothetical protein
MHDELWIKTRADASQFRTFRWRQITHLHGPCQHELSIMTGMSYTAFDKTLLEEDGADCA